MGNIIKGLGSYIPEIIKTNKDFENNTFFNDKNELIEGGGELITRKFKKITGIEERRYASDDLDASTLGFYAAQKAIEDARIDKEQIDHIIVAQNFGDVEVGNIQSEFMPSLASKIKQKLKIHNPSAVAYDVIFGCPGWVQGVIQADSFLKTGICKNALIVGCETLSRVVDEHDRDSMIFSDGAGACILSLNPDNDDRGIASFSSVTHAIEEADYLFCGVSNMPNSDRTKYIKMHGRKIYEYALSNVPLAMKDALDKSEYAISEVKKVFIHQANEKMDEAIIHRFYKLYEQVPPKNVMPMSIHKLGNSSVATVPTLMDLVKRGKLDDHTITEGDVCIIASVGAGMNINAIVYKF